MPALLSRRRRPARGPEAPLLEELLPRDEIIDRFDATYLDDLPDILRELHGITPANARDHQRWPQLRELWALTGRPTDEFQLDRLGEALVEDAAVDPRGYAPKEASHRVKRRFRQDGPAAWTRAAGIRLRGATSAAADAVNDLQRQYSLQSGGDVAHEFHDLGRAETGDPWTPLIKELVADGAVSAAEPVLTIGPRWVGEITYFRETLGLRAAIGLDLFSTDPELVVVGDMHAMPFDDDTFGLVYQRNTFDKSFDIRAALRECARVLRPGGILISDDCYAYTYGVSELARTNIKHNRQILRVLNEHVDEILYDRETDSEEDWIERVGQLAVRIR